jgi:hypothetical protein
MLDKAAEDRLEAGKKRLADIERRIGIFMPKTTGRQGAKRTEWRSDKVAVRRLRTTATKKKAK